MKTKNDRIMAAAELSDILDADAINGINGTDALDRIDNLRAALRRAATKIDPGVSLSLSTADRVRDAKVGS